MAAGRSCRAAAVALGGASSTAARIVARFRRHGEARLLDGRSDNGSRKVAADIRVGIATILEHRPPAFDFPRPTWTLELIARVIARELHLTLSLGHLCRVLHQMHVLWGRPRPVLACPWRRRRRQRREEQIQLLERHSVDFRLRHVEASRPGELLNQDTFYWGSLKGVGKVYVQVVVDVFCSLAFAKVYTSKMPITACDLLYDRVLPFYEALGVEVGAVLTDNGREYCGRPDSHPYQLLLAMDGIEHRTTRIRSPRTNGFVERMNRTLLDECFRVTGRTTWYLEPNEIQRDLDRFLAYYNLERSHQGYRLKGRTPAQALREALGIDELPALCPAEEEATTPAA